MRENLLLFYAVFHSVIGKCPHNLQICEFGPWGPWSQCSKSCGDGKQTRRRGLCCISGDAFNDCYKKCNVTESTEETRFCNTLCLNGGAFDGGCMCPHKFYGTCCENVRCSNLVPPHNGNISYSNGTKVGSVARYTCEHGFQMSDTDSERVCMNNGEWNGTDKDCSVRCDQLVAPENGNITYSNGTKVGSVAKYTCKEGFHMNNGDAHRICLDTGTLTGTDKRCNENCTLLAVPQDGNISYFVDNEVGSFAEYTCEEGFQLNDTDTKRICSDNGMWNGTYKECYELSTTELNPLWKGIGTTEDTMIIYSLTISGGFLMTFVFIVVILWFRFTRRRQKSNRHRHETNTYDVTTPKVLQTESEKTYGVTITSKLEPAINYEAVDTEKRPSSIKNYPEEEVKLYDVLQERSVVTYSTCRELTVELGLVLKAKRVRDRD